MNNILSLSIVDKIIGGAPYMCQGDFTERMRFAKELGYDGVELNIADPDRLDVDALEEAVNSIGIKIVAFGTGRAYVNDGVSLTDFDPKIRQAAINRLHQFIDIASRFHSIVIIGCIRGNIAKPEDAPEVFRLLGESMLHLDAYAGEKNVCMVFEPINRYENNFLCTVGSVADFIKENKLVNTKILTDTFHMNIEEDDLVQTIHTYGDYIAYAHLADSNRKYPGCGHTDFPAVIRALNDIGFSGPLDAECHAKGDLDEGCKAWLANVKALIK